MRWQRLRSWVAACGFAVVVFYLGCASLADSPSAKTLFDEHYRVPLRIHLLQARDQPRLQTTLTPGDIKRILGKVNLVWAQAGIEFSLESLVQEEASVKSLETLPGQEGKDRWLLKLLPQASRGGRVFNVYYVKEMSPNGYWSGGVVLVKDTAKLREVPGGIDEPLPRVTSHELGHALGLAHRQDTTNLMASGTTGTRLNEAEIQKARETAKKLEWVKKEPAKR